MIAPAALLLGSAACGSPADPHGLIAMWGATSLVGLHSHAIGPRGRALERVEAAHARRRAAAGRRLAALCGRVALEAVDDEAVEAANQVYWTRGPTDDEEWSQLNRARGALARLSRRIAQEEGR